MLLKRRSTAKRLHGAISQKAIIFIYRFVFVRIRYFYVFLDTVLFRSHNATSSYHVKISNAIRCFLVVFEVSVYLKVSFLPNTLVTLIFP
jgi:hypothetical protein